MAHALLIGLGGGLGAVARHAVDQVTITQLGSSLLGTFIANMSGTFLLGLLVGLFSTHGTWPEGVRIFVAVGFLASYTTFSTLSVATIELMDKGDLYGAVLNIGMSIFLGLISATVGIVLGKAI